MSGFFYSIYILFLLFCYFFFMRSTLLFLLFFCISISSSFAEMLTVPTSTPQSSPTVVEKVTQMTLPTQGQYTLFWIASPAAMKCFQDGGMLRGTKWVSGPVAYCVFNKPFQIIEEWAYFRGEIVRETR